MGSDLFGNFWRYAVQEINNVSRRNGVALLKNTLVPFPATRIKDSFFGNCPSVHAYDSLGEGGR